MTGRPYVRTAVLWALLVTGLILLAFPLGDLYRRPIAAAGEKLARLAAPPGVHVEVSIDKGKLQFTASRGAKGFTTTLSVRLLDGSAALFLATVLMTPLGSPGRRALGTALGFLAFILAMGVLTAGLALVPLVKGGFVESRLAWRMAALAHNVSSSGLLISFPAAIWFVSTRRWWRRRFALAVEAPGEGRSAAARGSRKGGRRRRRRQR